MKVFLCKAFGIINLLAHYLKPLAKLFFQRFFVIRMCDAY